MGGFLDARILKKKTSPQTHPPGTLWLQHPPQAIIKQRVWDEAFDDVVAQPKFFFLSAKKNGSMDGVMQEKWTITNYGCRRNYRKKNGAFC